MIKIEVKGPIVSNDTAWLYHYFGWDACCPKDISERLKEAAGDDVVLEINSPGGICSYGYEMYTALMEYNGRVTAHVITAASAASLLACAADEALASDTCIFMIHNTRSSVAGDYRDMQNQADALREYNEGVINAYVRKTGKSREELQEMMDNETYMSPETAIKHGFIDGYMFGNPEERKADTAPQNSMLLQAVNAALPIISEDRAKEIMAALDVFHDKSGMAGIAALYPGIDKDLSDLDRQAKMQNSSGNADSEIDVSANDAEKGEKKSMTLEEVYAKHPELRDEVNTLLTGAREEGSMSERKRLQALDALSASVTSDVLNDAKYGEKQMDAKELAYLALVEDGKKAENYMKNAMKDSQDSGVDNVGIGNVSEQTSNEADEIASYVNARRGGR